MPSSKSKRASYSNRQSEFRKSLDSATLPLTLVTERGQQRIEWALDVGTLDYQLMLPLMLSGVSETKEPYGFVAYEATLDMLENGAKSSAVLQALPMTVKQIKSLLETRDNLVVTRTLKVLQQLCACEGVGEALTNYYRRILPICNILKDKRLGQCAPDISDLITQTLEALEINGEEDALELIQHSVPTYVSCLQSSNQLLD